MAIKVGGGKKGRKRGKKKKKKGGRLINQACGCSRTNFRVWRGEEEKREEKKILSNPYVLGETKTQCDWTNSERRGRGRKGRGIWGMSYAIGSSSVFLIRKVEGGRGGGGEKKKRKIRFSLANPCPRLCENLVKARHREKTREKKKKKEREEGKKGGVGDLSYYGSVV